MAKSHKFAWNGLDVETTLGFEQLANMAQRAAQESTGDLMHGKHRIVSVRSTERQIEFRINDYLISFKKYMVFHLDFESRGGRTWMSSRIDWYVTTQPNVGGFIPVGFKTMIGHFTYMQFVRNLAEQVKAADSAARVTVREGTADSSKNPAPKLPENPAPGAVEAKSFAVPPPPAMPGRFAAPPPPPRPPAATPRPAPVPSPRGSSGMVTSVPGMVAHVRPPEPAEPPVPSFASLAEQLFAEDEELFHTQLVQRGASALPWQIRLADGSCTPLTGALVLGRNPVAPPSVSAVAIAVVDPDRSVSKTHALELRDGLPWLTDLNSSNGTTVTNDVGEAVVCEPGVALPVGDGWVAGLGEFNVRVERDPRGQ